MPSRTVPALTYRDPRTPWHARIVILLVVAYALSPIDLIPDFVPVLGYLDDLLIVPAGVALAVKLVPASVMAECRADVASPMTRRRPRSALGAAMVLALWILSAAAMVVLAWSTRTRNPWSPEHRHLAPRRGGHRIALLRVGLPFPLP